MTAAALPALRLPSLAGLGPRAALVAGAAVLAASPVAWLANSWADPSYASQGGAFFLVTATVFAWSWSSPMVSGGTGGAHAVRLLALTALVRAASTVLAIDTLGALVLAVDLFAAAKLAGLDRRARAVSPLWLAVSFLFALPVERLVQRLIGYALQRASAEGACGVLDAIFGEVACAGVRITVEGADVLVDLPCSGARAVMMFGFAFVLTAAVARPRLHMAAVGAALALTGAFAANLLRVVLLASGVAQDIDVMAQPLHDTVGLVSLAAASPFILLWARRVRPAPARAARRASGSVPAPLAYAFLALAVAVTALPARPIDVGAPAPAPVMPTQLLGHRAAPMPLTAQEQDYFAQYGGNAARAGYGAGSLLLTRTASPLRHLHTPDDCLRGSGFEVAYLGQRFAPVPTAVYRATKGDQDWRVETSFVSSQGHATASVAQSIWLWLRASDTQWSAVQRVTPWGMPEPERAAFDAAVAASLDLPITPRTTTQGEDR